LTLREIPLQYCRACDEFEVPEHLYFSQNSEEMEYKKRRRYLNYITGGFKLSSLSIEFKRKVADLYLENRKRLEDLDPNTLELFASELVEMINEEKKKSKTLHDLEILDYNMKMLQSYAAKLKEYEPETDEYDFTRNDCKNTIDSTKKWLKLEGLI
jgi:hypothetical protein